MTEDGNFLLTSFHEFILRCASSLEKSSLLCRERRLIFFSLIRLSAYSHNYCKLPVYNKDIPSPALVLSFHILFRATLLTKTCG